MDPISLTGLLCLVSVGENEPCLAVILCAKVDIKGGRGGEGEELVRGNWEERAAANEMLNK